MITDGGGSRKRLAIKRQRLLRIVLERELREKNKRPSRKDPDVISVSSNVQGVNIQFYQYYVQKYNGDNIPYIHFNTKIQKNQVFS